MYNILIFNSVLRCTYPRTYIYIFLYGSYLNSTHVDVIIIIIIIIN